MGVNVFKKKWQKTLFVGFIVSLAGQIKFDVFAPGFIIALSVLVMSIFIYCYETLSPRYIAFCSGIFSPLFRMVTLLLSGENLENSMMMAVPDILFFFSFGIFYSFIYKYIIKKPKTMANFPFVIATSDFLSNIMEFTARSLIYNRYFLALNILAYLFLVAVVRTIILQVIVVAFETYSELLLKKEHDEMYRKLIIQASAFDNELHIMEKNLSEIEDIMKEAFEIYREMDSLDVPRGLVEKCLEISKNAHEVKGDYKGILAALRQSYMDSIDGQKLWIRDILIIEKANALAYARQLNIKMDIHLKVRVDFCTADFYKLMSIIRNLLINGIEACRNNNRGIITIDVRSVEQNIFIEVKDNGQGIKESNLENIFLTGFSTKFNEKTGDIQRGIGLSIVKEYVEDAFKGTIVVDSVIGEGSKFTIKIPKNIVEVQ